MKSLRLSIKDGRELKVIVVHTSIECWNELGKYAKPGHQAQIRVDSDNFLPI